MNKQNKIEKCCCHKNKDIQEKQNESCCKKGKEEHSCCSNKLNKMNPKYKQKDCCNKEKDIEENKSCCKNKVLEESGSCCHKKLEENKDCYHEKIVEKHCCCANKSLSKEDGAKVEYDCCGNKIIKESSSNSGCCGKTNINKREMILRITFLSISFVMLILSYINIWKLVGLEKVDYLDFGYIAIILCGYPIFINAFRGLSHKKINSSLLVSTAITASIVLEIICRTTNIMQMGHSHSYIFAGGEIAFLMAVGSLIEFITLKASRKGIEKLISMSPKTANIKIGDEIKSVKIEDVKIGDIVLIKPNEMIPVDGVVLTGNSAVDQSNITGEFLPIDVSIGDTVYAGTFNKMGVIEVQATKETKDMTVNKLIHLALEAEEDKAPIVRVADKWATWLVPSAICLSVLVGIISYFAFNLTVIDAVIRSVTVLVVFCPCSLTLAAPTAVAAGIGSGAKNGIIVKSGSALETLASIDTMAFDKTGTITSGEVQVKEVITFGSDLDILQLTASVEKYSEHPIGQAIVKHAEKRVELVEPKDTKSEVGVGISAKINEDFVKVVSYKYAIEQYKDDDNLLSLSEFLDKGYTVVVTICNDVIIGAVCLYDTIRENAEIIMQKLNEKNIDTLMLTGDGLNSAQNIAEQCNIKNVKASLMPEDKLKIIKELKSENKTVCMVGDGVNDAPALATANCSIAMTNIGNDVAIETSDIAIMNKDIANVYNAVILSKKTLSTIKRNIIISMGINVCSVFLSMFGILTPITGAIVHNVTSVFVVGSSALILKTKYFKKSAKEKTLKNSK